MREALCIVLAVLVVMLPPKLVLAQAVQQEAVSMQRAAPAASLLRVSSPTGDADLLFGASPDRALLDADFADSQFAAQRPGWNWRPWAMVSGALVLAGTAWGVTDGDGLVEGATIGLMLGASVFFVAWTCLREGGTCGNFL